MKGKKNSMQKLNAKGSRCRKLMVMLLKFVGRLGTKNPRDKMSQKSKKKKCIEKNDGGDDHIQANDV